MLILAESEAYLLTRSAHVGAAAAVATVAVAVACCRRVRAEVHQIKAKSSGCINNNNNYENCATFIPFKLFRFQFEFNSFLFLLFFSLSICLQLL